MEEIKLLLLDILEELREMNSRLDTINDNCSNLSDIYDKLDDIQNDL